LRQQPAQVTLSSFLANAVHGAMRARRSVIRSMNLTASPETANAVPH
jgi:hypothetical protein